MLKTILYLSLIGFLSFCAPTGIDLINQEFEKKFADHAAQIKAERHQKLSQPIQVQQINNDKNRIQNTNSVQNNFPPDIFEIRYNIRPHPPFEYVGVEFDSIYIPSKDAFGVASELTSKSYALSGNDSFQRSLDKYIAAKDDADIQYSEALIKEQKAIYREEKMAKYLQEDEIQESNPPQEKWAEEKKKLRADPVVQTIAQQVVERNIYTNNPPPPQNQAPKK
jgi:hypothetical protein